MSKPRSRAAVDAFTAEGEERPVKKHNAGDDDERESSESMSDYDEHLEKLMADKADKLTGTIANRKEYSKLNNELHAEITNGTFLLRKRADLFECVDADLIPPTLVAAPFSCAPIPFCIVYHLTAQRRW